MPSRSHCAVRRCPRRLAAVLALGALLFPSPGRADVFDRLQPAHLARAIAGKEPLAELSEREAAAAQRLGGGISGTCIVVQTAGGNLAKAIIGWGLKKGPEKPLPVLMLERYVTYDALRPGVSLAAGKEVMLFAGFNFDFDLGQVVPDGLGGDVQFTSKRSLKALDTSGLFVLDGASRPAQAAGTPAESLDHEGVLPQDFSGSWRMNADGRWLGMLELTVDEKGNAAGEYLSDETQSTYKVIGKVEPGSHRLVLEVALVNAAQGYEAYLWTSDKSTMAGTTTLADRKFGFFAVRQEEPGEPQALDASAGPPAAPPPGE